MPATLTEEEFSKHLNTTFRITNPQPVELELIEVKGYFNQPHEQGGMERFSAYFQGPSAPWLQQGIYSLEHEAMGGCDLFLVPVKKDEKGYRYEAVFNYFKEK